MIEGRLAEAQELKNVPLGVTETAPDVRIIQLRDEGGVILETTASDRAGEEQETNGEQSHSENEEEEGGGGARAEPASSWEEELILELEAVQTRTHEPEAEMDR